MQLSGPSNRKKGEVALYYIKHIRGVAGKLPLILFRSALFLTVKISGCHFIYTAASVRRQSMIHPDMENIPSNHIIEYSILYTF